MARRAHNREVIRIAIAAVAVAVMYFKHRLVLVVSTPDTLGRIMPERDFSIVVFPSAIMRRVKLRETADALSLVFAGSSAKEKA